MISYRTFILALFLCFRSAGSFQQDIQYARSVVEKLSSAEFRGRGFAGDGIYLAADFITREFQKYGLIPFNGDYYQTFEVAVNIFPKNVSFKINGKSLRPAVDFWIESSSPPVKGKFGIFKTDRGNIATEEGLTSVLERAGSGFILLDNRGRKDELVEVRERIDENIALLKYDKDISCKGLIIFTDEKVNWETSTFRNIRPVFFLSSEVDITGMTSCRVDIDSEFRIFETSNITGYIEGSLHPDSFIVIMGHYDHLGLMGKDTYFPGANDNASGVAMVLSLAKYYSENSPAYSMVFLSPSAEEIGLMGSRVFTENPLFPLNTIRFLVNFDLAGTGEEGIRVVNATVFTDEFNLLDSINREKGLLKKIDKRGEACISDHCFFNQKGVPGFYIYTQGGLHAYHDLYDRAETLSMFAFEDYLRLMITFFNAL